MCILYSPTQFQSTRVLLFVWKMFEDEDKSLSLFIMYYVNFYERPISKIRQTRESIST